MNGWLIIDKPLGLGSTQGVSAVKRALREGEKELLAARRTRRICG